MTFYGLGYHGYRERWITEEWFWQQTPIEHVEIHKRLSPEEIQAQLAQRMEGIADQLHAKTQTEAGHMFETLADITDDDTALAELQDLGLL